MIETDYYKEVDRPDWINYFLGLAFVISERSEDNDTHHGCILTDRNNHIIGTGYNSLPRGISKGLLSNTRPLKYQYMIHSEENALLNITTNLWLLPFGGIAYITAKPCFRCLTRLWNENITEIFYAEVGYHFKDWEAESEIFTKFIEDVDLKVHAIKPDLEWLKKPLQRLNLIDKTT